METREFRAPAFVERWSWDDLERLGAHRIDHPRFGLTGLGASRSERLVLVDRFFPTGDDGELGAKVLALPELDPVATIPINAQMSSPVFDDSGERVAMVLYDQDRCSANVYRLGGAGAELVADLASKQIVTDFERACVAFLPGDRLAVWSVKGWSFEGQVGVYDLATGEARFVAAVGHAELEVDDPDEFSFRLENTELSLLAGDRSVVVGAVGAVVTVDLVDGAATATPIEGAGAIVSVRRCGEAMVALDHDNALFVVAEG